MTNIKRYYAVKSPKGRAVHRMFSATKTEGNLTSCGRFVGIGWHWATRVRFFKASRCKQCYS